MFSLDTWWYTGVVLTWCFLRIGLLSPLTSKQSVCDVSQSCCSLPSETIKHRLELLWTELNWFLFLPSPTLLCFLYIVPHSSSCWLPFVSELSPSFRCTSWLRSSSRTGSQFALRARTALVSLLGMWCARGSWWILMILRALRSSNCPCFNSTSRCGVCSPYRCLPVSEWHRITSWVSLSIFMSYNTFVKLEGVLL